ncbi:low temperature requirement protein A [Cellulomonas cellasea]|uniref:Low temperature requirement protein LtrA n=1 Tax=Cellulomonas cellasea TaxID=43670 RepID=A0A7W4UHH7_9CELL|nr:low temperature requirement protein LtrA [Cellulomonas cellasea]
MLFVALGLKKAMSYVSDPEHHALSEPLSSMPLLSLYVGAAVYVVGHAAFLRRTGGTWAVPHLVMAGVVLALLPLAARLPALAAMALVAALLVGLVVVDLSSLKHRRDQIRHGHAPAPAA